MANYDKSKIEEDFFEFLRFESIGTDPAFKEQTLACADWVEKYLKDSGLDVERFETDGFPILMGSWLKAGPDKPTVLLYNHYDVQPVDPIEKWVSPPFEPTVRDGEVYARGATDNKGPCMYVMAAIRSLLKEKGELPVNVKLIIEGEEESGSVNFGPFLEKHAEAVKADNVLIVDVGLHSMERPSVTIGTRGLVSMEVTLKGSDVDLHSGSFGGLAYNPNHALAELLARMRDENGKIAIPGFYDNVETLSDKERREIDFNFDEQALATQLGIQCTGGEKGYSPLESAWLRPTLEVNGISGGYAGEGFKTVIPMQANAKISCRLAPGQDPDRISSLIEKFVKDNTPDGIEAEFKAHAGKGVAVRTSPTSKLVQICVQAVSHATEKDTSCVLEGATIPITAALRDASGGEVAYLGYMLPEDCLHAPNERYGLDRLEIGFHTICEVLELLAKD